MNLFQLLKYMASLLSVKFLHSLERENCPLVHCLILPSKKPPNKKKPQARFFYSCVTFALMTSAKMARHNKHGARQYVPSGLPVLLKTFSIGAKTHKRRKALLRVIVLNTDINIAMQCLIQNRVYTGTIRRMRSDLSMVVHVLVFASFLTNCLYQTPLLCKRAAN